ncbi:glycosyltransferase family 4 protein [Algoriphagus sp.]|uniref:glycosyltransferase family 4 protein n=1 Tax=Algoriphagus sp. TaxID=1872435 RepID=UPI003F71C617
MDDLMLVELMVDFKRSALVKVTVTFSFHGHRLILPPAFGADVDKVLFLTKMGYYESLRLNEVFTPEVHIVGNGVNSSQFFPVSKDQKHILRRNLGFVETDEIIVWMANERPKKGLHLFLKIAHKLLQLYPTIQFVVLGNKKPLTIQSNRIKAFGQVSNVELPKYLQAADYYFFTTLWKEGFGLSMVEAAKCGCTIIASDNGGVSEVNQELPQSYLVKAPNMVEEWLQVFKEARMGRSNYNSEEKRGELEKFQSYELWERKYLAALEY